MKCRTYGYHAPDFIALEAERGGAAHAGEHHDVVELGDHAFDPQRVHHAAVVAMVAPRFVRVAAGHRGDVGWSAVLDREPVQISWLYCSLGVGEVLGGDRSGQHSVRINDRWRVCFRWTEGGVEDVEIVDYH